MRGPNPRRLPIPEAPHHAAAPPASRRAEAWVHAVLNPLIDTLPNEIALLGRGNVTFNCDTKDLRHIRSVEDSLTAPARHVLRDFTRANPDADEPIRTRDAAVRRVAETARAAYEALVRIQAFRDAVAAVAARASEPGTPQPRGFAVASRAAIDPEQLIRAFAEFVVNRRGEMTDFETDLAGIWNRERETMLRHRTGAPFAQCDDARSALLAADRRLLDWLKDKSFALCGQFDIAAGPVGEAR